MSKIDLSIITISYNTKQIMRDCLESIVKYTKGINFEIIVVENGSMDGSLKMLHNFSKKRPELILIDAKENLGFGRGNNRGADRAKGEYLLFINSDTLIFNNAIKNALENFKAHPESGVYSCQLLNGDKTHQPSGGHFPTLGRLLAWQFFIDDLPFIGDLIKSIHPHEPGFFFWHQFFLKKDTRVKSGIVENYPDWVTGDFMMVKKNIFEEVGGFDKNIFMYTEEMELCYRIRKLEYKTYYSDTPAIIHLGGASGGSILAITSEIKNMIYFWKKHKQTWQLPLVKFAFFIGSLLRLLIFGIIKGDEKARRAYLQSLGYIL